MRCGGGRPVPAGLPGLSQGGEKLRHSLRNAVFHLCRAQDQRRDPPLSSGRRRGEGEPEPEGAGSGGAYGQSGAGTAPGAGAGAQRAEPGNGPDSRGDRGGGDRDSGSRFPAAGKRRGRSQPGGDAFRSGAGGTDDRIPGPAGGHCRPAGAGAHGDRPAVLPGPDPDRRGPASGGEPGPGLPAGVQIRDKYTVIWMPFLPVSSLPVGR